MASGPIMKVSTELGSQGFVVLQLNEMDIAVAKVETYQRRIQNSVKHLKSSSSYYPLTI